MDTMLPWTCTTESNDETSGAVVRLTGSHRVAASASKPTRATHQASSGHQGRGFRLPLPGDRYKAIDAHDVM